MHPAYEYAIFDLDGTLTDPGPGITGSVAYALERMDRPVPPRRELYRFIGPPLVYSFMTFCGMDEEEAWRAVGFYRERFLAGGIFENEIYPGVAELLEKLRSGGAKIFLATGKPEEFAVRILDHFGILRYFDLAAGNTLDEKRPEKRDVIKHIISAYPDIRPDNTVLVGDSKYDIEAAKEFSFTAVGVLYGFGSAEELVTAGADLLAESVPQLETLLLHRD